MADEFKLSGWRSTKPTLGYDLVELNHYAVKSYEAYLLRRMRGNVNNKEDKYNASYFAIFDRNEEEVRGAADRGPRVRALMDELLQDAQLAELQATRRWPITKTRSRRCARPANTTPGWPRLQEAGGRSIAELETVLFTLHLPKKYQEVVKHLQARGVPDELIAKMVNAQQTGRKAATRESLRAVSDGQEAPEVGDMPGEPPEDADKTPEELAEQIMERMKGTKKLQRALDRAAAAKGSKPKDERPHRHPDARGARQAGRPDPRKEDAGQL